MLDSEVDAFFDVAVLDLLVDDNTDCRLRNIVDYSSLTVIDLMRHAESKSVLLNGCVVVVDKPFLDSSVGLDVDNISDPTQPLATRIPSEYRA